jgi:thiol-disulfide isomerase/thioredoxin
MARLAACAVALVLSSMLVGCSNREAPATGAGAAKVSASTAASAPIPVRALANGARGDAVVVPETPAQLKQVIHERGAPVTLVNVWATWCAPCREEMPDLLETARQHPDVRLVLVSADFDDHLKEAREFLAARGITGTTYWKSGSDQEFIDALDPDWTGSLPATLVCDASGRPVAFWEGKGDRARFEAAIQKARSSH